MESRRQLADIVNDTVTNDIADATLLADLLRMELLPEAWVAPGWSLCVPDASGRRGLVATRMLCVASSGMEMPPDARRHIENDRVVWFTSVTDGGAPAPSPVWFVPDGEDLVVFSEPTSRRVHNTGQRPLVALHFNSDPKGSDAWIITGTATIRHGVKPSSAPGYLDRYRASIEGELQTTVEAIDAAYNTEIRVHPIKIRTT